MYRWWLVDGEWRYSRIGAGTRLEARPAVLRRQDKEGCHDELEGASAACQPRGDEIGWSPAGRGRKFRCGSAQSSQNEGGRIRATRPAPPAARVNYPTPLDPVVVRHPRPFATAWWSSRRVSSPRPHPNDGPDLTSKLPCVPTLTLAATRRGSFVADADSRVGLHRRVGPPRRWRRRRRQRRRECMRYT